MTSFAAKTNRGALVAAALTVAAGLGFAAPAAAQTVEDYENALLTAAKAADVDGACRPLVNYAFVSIAPTHQASPSPVVGLFQQVSDLTLEADPAAAARAACLARLTKPVITFNGGLGEDIVAQPAVEDPTRPLGEQRPSY